MSIMVHHNRQHQRMAERLPAALIQAQRDFFDALTYRRTGRDGMFHAEWSGDCTEGRSGGSAAQMVPPEPSEKGDESRPSRPDPAATQTSHANPFRSAGPLKISLRWIAVDGACARPKPRSKPDTFVWVDHHVRTRRRCARAPDARAGPGQG